MTFAEMQARTLVNVADADQRWMTASRLKAILNDAMRYVSNYAAAQSDNLFHHSVSASFSPSGDYYEISLSGSSPTFSVPSTRPFRRPLWIDRTDHPSGRVVKLPNWSFHDRDRWQWSQFSAQEPPWYLRDTSIGLVRPCSAIALTLYYQYDLPDMVADTDTPGLSNGSPSGGGNALPACYHDLIPAYAASLALSGQNSDGADRWMKVFERMLSGLRMTLVGRRGPRRVLRKSDLALRGPWGRYGA